MTIFRESDKKVFERLISERCDIDPDDDELETTIEYSISVRYLKERLNLMGFSLGQAESDFNENRIAALVEIRDYIDSERSSDTLSSLYREQIRVLEQTTFNDWLQAFNRIYLKNLCVKMYGDKSYSDESFLVQYILGPNDGDEPFYKFPSSDIRFFLRSFLEFIPDECIVAQDITDLVNAGYYHEDDEVCRISIQELTQDYPVNEKIIILAEGSTDINVLEQSLKLLYPHLADYYSFMDFGLSNAQGSAGNLVNTVKAFVGSGISNRILALFDNDSAGFDAIRGFNKTCIPSNIKILTYPNFDLAKSYPTLGPTGLSNLDINGLACSLELYFGQDVLKSDGNLLPIQWKGYIDGVKKYQGEIMQKAKLYELFREKLRMCALNPNLIKSTDWSGLHLILNSIFKAFQE